MPDCLTACCYFDCECVQAFLAVEMQATELAGRVRAKERESERAKERKRKRERQRWGKGELHGGEQGKAT